MKEAKRCAELISAKLGGVRVEAKACPGFVMFDMGLVWFPYCPETDQEEMANQVVDLYRRHVSSPEYQARNREFSNMANRKVTK